MDKESNTILELRKKLEIRTWFLRGSLGLNIAMIAGLTLHILNSVGII